MNRTEIPGAIHSPADLVLRIGSEERFEVRFIEPDASVGDRESVYMPVDLDAAQNRVALYHNLDPS